MNKIKRENKLTKRAVRQMVRGYARTNKSIQNERRAWLTRLTMEEARRLFDELHQNAEQWKQFGGDLGALEKRRMASKIAGRRVMARVAQRSTK